MPSRFDRYRFRDGVTPLAERTFNPIFRDLDLRIATLEDLKIAWQEVVRTVTDFGLVRINEVLGPAFTAMDDHLAAAGGKLDTIEAKRQEALAAVAAKAALRAAAYQLISASTATANAAVAIAGITGPCLLVGWSRKGSGNVTLTGRRAGSTVGALTAADGAIIGTTAAFDNLMAITSPATVANSLTAARTHDFGIIPV